MGNPFLAALSLLRTILWKAVWEIRGKHQDVLAARGGVGMSLKEMDDSTEYVAKTLELRADDTLLDIGCSLGYMVEKFAVTLTQVTAIDMSSTAVSNAKELLRHRKNVEIFQAEATAVPKPSGSFSKILCLSVVQCFPSKMYWREFLSEVKRLLKPGGVALISDIPEKGKMDFDLMSRYGLVKKLYMVPITIGVGLAIQRRYTRAEVVQNAAEAQLVARIIPQPKSLPYSASRFDVLLSHD